MDFKSVGKNICQCRQKKHMRQEELAEKAGISPNYLGALERGEKRPSFTAFIKLANALEVSADLLLADVTSVGYTVKESVLAEKLEGLSQQDRQEIYEVVDVNLGCLGPDGGAAGSRSSRQHGGANQQATERKLICQTHDGFRFEAGNFAQIHGFLLMLVKKI